MSSSAGERTEKASSKKLRDARKRGEVAVARDLTSAVLLLATFTMVLYRFEAVALQLRQTALECFLAVRVSPSPSELIGLLGKAIMEVGIVIAPIIVVAVVIAAGVPFLQIGPLLTFESLRPRPDRLNPISGLKQKVFSGRSWVELGKSGILMAVILIMGYTAARENLRAAILTCGSGVDATLNVLQSVLSAPIWRILGLFLAVAAADLLYQRWQFARDQRMTKDERKREYKEQEGDPSLKQARKHQHLELAMNTMLHDVAAKASVVVKNPTHFACALYYDPDDEGAPPKLIGKGQGWLAEKIREVAKREGIPIVRDVPLARALYQLEIDDSIPRELYESVIEVLRWAEQIDESLGRVPRWKRPV